MVGLELFHGRTDPAQDMDGWGTKGPVFLVEYVHTTYGTDIKLGIPHPKGDGDLKVVDGLVYYDGVYYGDWSVFPASLLDTEPSLKARLTTYDPAKAIPPQRTAACTCCRHYRGTFQCGGIDCQECEGCSIS